VNDELLTAPPAWLPTERHPHVNGGAAFKGSSRLRFRVPGDGVTGTVVAERVSAPSAIAADGSHVLTVRALAGQSDGEPVPKDNWVDVWFNCADLRMFYDRETPAVGDVLTVVFQGTRRPATTQGNGLWSYPRKSFACGIERPEADEW
jgi:hypothetical protein